MFTRRGTTASVLVACTLAACAGGVPAEETAAVEVTGTSFSYEPDELSLTEGSTVEVHFIVDDAPHDLVFEGHELHLDGDAGDRIGGLLEVSGGGVYAFYCTLPGHRAAGMEGTLRVD